MTSETDVIIIGAGLAGLAAAATLKRRGLRAVVMEASARAGGRAYTTHPAELGGTTWFDHGAMWLHAADRNPLVPIARAAGENLVASDIFRTERSFVGSHLATAEETADYEKTWPTFTATADAILATQDDAPLAAVAQRMADNPWAVAVENWEGPVINVADANAFSLRDWRTNVLEGPNLIIPGGIGAFAERVLAPMAAEIYFHSPATRVRWQCPDGVAVETPRGTLRAGAVIVTVSTGVLTSGAIAFDPALPDTTKADLRALPMGLALKIAFRATGEDRLDLPDHCSIDRQVGRSGEPAMVFSAWPTGRNFLSGWVGGSFAWDLNRAGPRAIEDFARSELRRSLGSRIDRALQFALITQWGNDPHYQGAYAYARPGMVAARSRLAAPLGDGQFQLAGEAFNSDGLAGTLAGAWNSGVRAAEAVIPAR